MKRAPFVTGACCALALALAATGAQAKDSGKFPFHDGDRVVFLGDSITAQRLYTTYLETYLLTRFPTWHLQFRNAGWGGDTSYLRTRGVPPKEGLQRDVLSLNPTVVTIDFSMNDAGYGGFQQNLYDQHMVGENAIVAQLQAAHVLPVVLTASAVEKGEAGDNLLGYNQTLEQFAAGDASVAAKAGVPFADQFHPFVAAINRLRTIGGARLSGDAVHPGNGGHLMMADFILTGLNAPPLVSSASIDARDGYAGGDGARITDVKRYSDGISFRRLDQALLFPIEPAARPVLQIVPVADDIDRYMVQVTHLAAGSYDIFVDGKLVTCSSAAQLSEGVNLGSYDSPLAAAGTQIMQHVRTKNDLYDSLWHGVELGNLSPADKDTQRATYAQKIAAEEAQINALRVPAAYTFVIKRSISPVAPATTPVK